MIDENGQVICPECGSPDKYEVSSERTTFDRRILYKCCDCKEYFRMSEREIDQAHFAEVY
jgi:DNA-directed RNA polymerase subunit RPC12/RpoP